MNQTHSVTKCFGATGLLPEGTNKEHAYKAKKKKCYGRDYNEDTVT